MNIIEAYEELKRGGEVLDVDLRPLTINRGGILCVKETGKYVPFSAWAMRDNSFHYAEEFARVSK